MLWPIGLLTRRAAIQNVATTAAFLQLEASGFWLPTVGATAQRVSLRQHRP